MFRLKGSVQKIMPQFKWLLRLGVFSTCVLNMTLGITPDLLTEYQPSPDQRPPSGYSDSSGVRIFINKLGICS